MYAVVVDVVMRLRGSARLGWPGRTRVNGRCGRTVHIDGLRCIHKYCTYNTNSLHFGSCVTWNNSGKMALDSLIQPASKWMHRATLRRHSDLFRAATSAASQLIPILNKSLLTVLLQLVHGRLGPLLNPVQCLSRYALVVHSYHVSKHLTCHKYCT